MQCLIMTRSQMLTVRTHKKTVFTLLIFDAKTTDPGSCFFSSDADRTDKSEQSKAGNKVAWRRFLMTAPNLSISLRIS